MGLPHFRNIGSVYGVPALCEICNEAGNHYGYGRDRVSEYSEVHDFCSEHGWGSIGCCFGVGRI
jgi:hypothetical protein